MKIDFVKSLIAIAISALLAYAIYEICNYEQVKWVITIGAFVTIVFPMLFAMGISAKQERGAIMLKALSYVFLTCEIILNGIFVLFDFSVPLYIIINGIILLIYVLIYYFICKTHM